MDLVDEEDTLVEALHLLHHRFQPLLEVAAIARAGEQRAHVERVDHRIVENFRHIAIDDLLGQALGDGRLADTGVANQDGIVLVAPAQDLDAALDLHLTPDQRVDLSGACLFVEVHAVGIERFIARLHIAILVGFGPTWRGRARRARFLGHPVRDVVHRIIAGHVLLLQEEGGMALALGKDRDQHIRAGHLIASGAFDMQDGALDHTLEGGSRLHAALILFNDQAGELGIEIMGQLLTELFQFHLAGGHHLGGILILDQGEQEVFQSGIFVVSLRSQAQRSFEGGLQGRGQAWHITLL